MCISSFRVHSLATILIVVYSGLANYKANACLRSRELRASKDGEVLTGQAGLQTALGGNIHATPFESGSTGALIQRGRDLSCTFDDACRWRNVQTETLEWSRGAGHAEPIRWNFATETQEQPAEPFVLLASNPRDESENGQLVSDPIGCQQGDGTLSFKHWTSVAREEGQQPQLQLCVRSVGSTDVKQCQSVTNESPGPTTFTIPGPVEGPFEFVLRGIGFVNSPEGGFIVLDDIIYTADVLPQNTCPPQDGPEPNIDDIDELDGNIYYDQQTTKEPTAAPTTEALNLLSYDREACGLGQCSFGLDEEFCRLNPFGDGSIGRGIDRGWEITTGRLNRANPLTGVRSDYQRSRDGAFAVADFPDPRQERINPGMKYVIETPELTFSQEQYLHFKRFLATEGTQISVCQDSNGRDCLYESEPLVRGSANAIANRNWVDEIVPLPPGTYKLYIIAAYDTQRRYNAGQVGLSFLNFYQDRNLRDPLC